MEALPEPIILNPSIGTYFDKERSGFCKLHNLNRSAETWPQAFYVNVIISAFLNTLNSTFIISVDEDEVWHILDGGHRTRAILYYLEDKFSVSIENIPRKFSELDKKFQQKLLNKSLTIVTYKKLTAQQEETLFFQCNISLPLSPGECINAFHTIPICTLAKKLAIQYSKEFKNMFSRAILNDDKRCDSSNIMMSLLENFYYGNIITSEKISNSKQEELKKRCEKFRGKKIDIPDLKSKVAKLFESVPKHSTGRKFPSYVLHTVQCILIQFPGIDIEKIKTWLENETMDPSDKWMQYSRANIENPNKPLVCKKRADIFIEKYRDI